MEKAFRARVRVEHPDRFPPGSEAWEDAARRVQELVEARRVLTSPGGGAATSAGPGSFVAGTTADGDRWAWAADAPAPVDEGFLTEVQVDRRKRAWGYGWGSFLVASAGVSVAIGAGQPTNDAFPFWAPALAVTGATALVIGWRADRRLARG